MIRMRCICLSYMVLILSFFFIERMNSELTIILISLHLDAFMFNELVSHQIENGYQINVNEHSIFGCICLSSRMLILSFLLKERVYAGLTINICDNTPPADPTISASINHLWPVIYPVVFSSLARGISHFFTDTQSPTERVEEKNKLTRAWVSFKRKKGRGSRQFLCVL